MSPNGAGSDPDCHGFIWSGLVLCDPPPLSCGWMGMPGRPVTEILQKRHMRDTCSFSHHLCQSHGGRRGGREGGGVSVSCPWSELCLTYLLNVRSCIFIQPPPAEWQGGEYECVWVVHSRLYQTSFPSFLFSSPQAPILRCGLVKVTLQCSTRCDFIGFFLVFFLSLFNPVSVNLVEFASCLSRTRGYCGTSCVDFSYTTLFQLCENKMMFLLQK